MFLMFKNVVQNMIKQRYIFKKTQILGMKVIKSEMEIILGGINHQIKITKNQKQNQNNNTKKPKTKTQ